MRGGASAGAAAAALLAFACQQAETAPLYEKVPVVRRDVVVTVIAQGLVRPILTFSVKSKAWGQIVEVPVQTGDEVKRGQLLARIDPRIPQQNLTQAQASLDKARAQLANATAQLQRSEALFQSNAIAEVDYNAARLAAVTAQAAVATATGNLQIAQDAMQDTHVRAPITGTILELDAVLGTVISSPTLGGGTVIIKMASLDTVQDSALVAETDIGKVQPGTPATISVDAYANRSFEGTILKIQPQAQVVQNATMFPVLIGIANPGHLLKPGMNSQVRVHTGQRQGALTVPNAALRTTRDLATDAGLLGLDAQAVQQQVAQAEAADTLRRRPTMGGDTAGGGGATLTTPSGKTIRLPPGVTEEQARAAMTKMRSGGEATPADRAMLRSLFGRAGGGGGGGSGGGGQGRGRFGGPGRRTANSNRYVVFALRGGKIVPVPVRAGLSDLDYSEVMGGLVEHDTVLVLPSASLVQAQQQFKQRFQNVTGGGLPGLRQQQSQGATSR